MSRKIKIAIVCDSMSINGISKVVENYAIYIDKKKFDITIFGSMPIDTYFIKMYKDSDGINLVSLPNKHRDTLKYYFQLFNCLKREKFDIFHLHGNSVNTFVQLALAKYAGIKVRIMHCHNTKCKHPMLTNIFRPFFNYYCTEGFACGKDAGKWVWPDENFIVIPNGFSVDKFKYDEIMRDKIRDDLGYSDKIILGNLGRLNDQKNQLFLIDIFEKVAILDERYVLLLVGSGPDLKIIKKRMNESKFRERMKLYGETTEPNKIYSAMDYLIFPSKYEGLPIVLLEAQISGLKCIVSDRITKEVDFGDIDYLPIDEGVDIWTKAILTSEVIVDRTSYFDLKSYIISDYNILENVKTIEYIYEKLVGGK